MGLLDFLFNLFCPDDNLEQNTNEEQKPNYKIKQSQITECEKYFYDIFKKHFSNNYDVRPQIPLSSIIEKEKNFSREYQNELYRVIDFGIFDKNTLRPLLLIEINDSTHSQKNRRERDTKVKSICDNAGIKLITFWTKFDNTETYIVNRINKELKIALSNNLPNANH